MILPIKILNDLIGSTLHRLNISLIVDNGDGTYTLTVDNTFYLTINRVIDINGNSYTIQNFVLNESITISGTIRPTVDFFDIDPPTFVHGTPQAVNGEHDGKIVNNTNYPFIWLLEFMESNYDDSDESVITATLDLNLFFLTDVNFEDFDIDKSQSYAIDPMSNEIDFFIRTLKTRRDLFGEFLKHSITNHINFGTYIVDEGYKTQIITDHLSGCQLKLNLPYVVDFCNGIQKPVSICKPVSIYENLIFKESVEAGGRFDYTSGGGDATEIIKDTGGNILYTNVIPSGGTNNQTIADATNTLNDVPIIGSLAEGTKDIYIYDSDFNKIGTPSTDTITQLGVDIADGTNTLNGGAISGILAEGTKAITLVDDLGATIIPTILVNTKTNLDLEVSAGVSGIAYMRNSWVVGDLITSYLTGDLADYNNTTQIFNYNTEGIATLLDKSDPTKLLTLNFWGNLNRVTNDKGGSNYIDVGGGLTSDGATADYAVDNYTGKGFYLNAVHGGGVSWVNSVIQAKAFTLSAFDGSTYGSDNYGQFTMPTYMDIHNITIGTGQNSNLFSSINNWFDVIHFVMYTVSSSSALIWRETVANYSSTNFQGFSTTSGNSGIDLIVTRNHF